MVYGTSSFPEPILSIIDNDISLVPDCQSFVQNLAVHFVYDRRESNTSIT